MGELSSRHVCVGYLASLDSELSLIIRQKRSIRHSAFQMMGEGLKSWLDKGAPKNESSPEKFKALQEIASKIQFGYGQYLSDFMASSIAYENFTIPEDAAIKEAFDPAKHRLVLQFEVIRSEQNDLDNVQQAFLNPCFRVEDLK